MFYEQNDNFSDRLILRNYILDLEIGAYNSEKNCTQKVKFDVILDVVRSAGIESDDVKDILSYEIIIEAIKKVTSGKRINLLEKCAELIANICLDEKEVEKAHVRIEKLERIKGELGIEIIREKKTSFAVKSLKKDKLYSSSLKDFFIAYIPNSSLKNKNISLWFDKFYKNKNNFIFCIDPSDLKIIKDCTKSVNTRILELSYKQNALLFMDLRDYFFTFNELDNLNYPNKNNKIGIFLPNVSHINKILVSSDPLSYPQISLRYFEDIIFKRFLYIGEIKSKTFSQFEKFNVEELDKFV